MYRANVTLGVVAIRRGDRAGAVRHMRLAVETPGSPEVAGYAQSMLRHRLVNYRSKRASASPSRISSSAPRRSNFYERDRALNDAKAIREGRMPMGYQSSLTAH